jgi:hypothetical protein
MYNQNLTPDEWKAIKMAGLMALVTSFLSGAVMFAFDEVKYHLAKARGDDEPEDKEETKEVSK